MTRLIASGLLPERAGQPVKAWVNVSLGDLMLLEGSSALLGQWTDRMRARWVSHRAAASGGSGSVGDNGGAWLDGGAAQALTCDAVLAPVVTGDVDPAAFDDLVPLCVELDKLRHDHDHDHDTGSAGGGGGPRPVLAAGMTGTAPAAWAGRPGAARGRGPPRGAAPGQHLPVPAGAGAGHRRQGRRPAVRPRRAGVVPAPSAPRRPAGRAEPAAGHRLQRHHPGLDPQRGQAPRPTLPVGGRLQPARRRVRRAPYKTQGQRRQDQPQGLRAAMQVPPSDRHPPLGLDLIVNPDGTTTAWNKDKTKVLHSHSPPARAG